MIAVKEQITKTVVRSGNGGAVWVPKSWMGEEVVVILPEKPKLDVRDRIIHALEPYLKDIISVGIYGSYARQEQTKDSDIDVLVVTKDVNLKLTIKSLDIIAMPLEKWRKAIQKYPVMYYQIVQEAEALVNASVLDELKKVKQSKSGFGSYLQETKAQVRSSRELLELDKLDGDQVKSTSIVYSSILRLKGLYIMHCLLAKEAFTSKKFRQWLIKQGLRSDEFESAYAMYREVRDNVRTRTKLEVITAVKMLDILEKELHEEIQKATPFRA